MKHSCLNSRMALFNPFHGILFICMSFSLETATEATFLNVSDRLALLDFRKLITQDPHKIMSSWNDSIHFCNWVGVSCSLSNGRVVTLNLESQNLVSSIPPSIGNLTYLTGINLRNNSFHGELPEDLGRLSRLQHLNVTFNFFGGRTPTNLTHCTELTVLSHPIWDREPYFSVLSSTSTEYTTRKHTN
ncbi:hypothetical protein DKX38_024308 [Salix brachista]|uniref:Leucine-rich repeat-containing N-terminal plant-type domain-containing protein n=1 Tax=Salix brachista TaxID=2182728 RepID=A0A5N5JL07_9ROSI|nr:hypothetical protein DKX38_024308 [Salix brachista]